MTRYLLGTSDRAIPPSLEEFMARRAHSHITEVDAGHLVMLSHPRAVTRVIERAATASQLRRP